MAPGDKIETAGATATAINQDGSKVTVNPYSAIRYESQGVNVVRGTAAVTTTDGMTAQAAQITVAPKDKTATYEIARLNNQVVITSHTRRADDHRSWQDHRTGSGRFELACRRRRHPLRHRLLHRRLLRYSRGADSGRVQSSTLPQW